jgi:peptidyl-prolyl cis-trans isomerase SurA
MHGFRRSLILMGTLIAVGIGAGCRSTPATPAPAAPVITPDTWAVVDGRTISRDTVEKLYRRMRNPAETPSEEEATTAKLSLLNELIIQDILLAKARQLKIEVPASEIETAYSDSKKAVSDEAFQQELTRRQLTIADVRETLGRDLLADKVLNQEVGAKVAVTEQEITEAFNANKAGFNVPEESYHIAQIVITPVRDAQVANRTGDDAATPQAAAAKAQMLMQRLQTGATFSDIAMDYSEDPQTAPRGGDLGLVPVSRLKQAPPQLRDAVLKMTPGTVNMMSEGGAHTIMLMIAHEPAGQRDLTTPAVREQITEALKTRKEQLLRAAYLASAQADAKVTNYLARRVVESNGKLTNSQPAAPKP